jgi:hypothetical protein
MLLSQNLYQIRNQLAHGDNNISLFLMEILIENVTLDLLNLASLIIFILFHYSFLNNQMLDQSKLNLINLWLMIILLGILTFMTFLRSLLFLNLLFN